MHPAVRAGHDAERCVSMYGLPGCDQPADRYRENANKADTQLLVSGPDRTRVMSAAMDEIKYAQAGMFETLGLSMKPSKQHTLMAEAEKFADVLRLQVGSTFKEACAAQASIFTPIYEHHARGGPGEVQPDRGVSGSPGDMSDMQEEDERIMEDSVIETDGDAEVGIAMEELAQEPAMAGAAPTHTAMTGAGAGGRLSKAEKAIRRQVNAMPMQAMMDVFESPPCGGGSPWEKYTHRLMMKMRPLMLRVAACHNLPPPTVPPLPPAVRPGGNTGQERRRQGRRQAVPEVREEQAHGEGGDDGDDVVEEWMVDGSGSEEDEPDDDDPCEECGKVQSECTVPQMLCSNEECGRCFCPACVGVEELPDGDWWCERCVKDATVDTGHAAMPTSSDTESSDDAEAGVDLAHRTLMSHIRRHPNVICFSEHIVHDLYRTVYFPCEGAEHGMRRFNVGDCVRLSYQVEGRRQKCMGFCMLVKLHKGGTAGGRFEGLWLWPKFDTVNAGNSVMSKSSAGFNKADLFVSVDISDCTGEIESLDVVVQVLAADIWPSATKHGKPQPHGPWQCKALLTKTPPGARWELFSADCETGVDWPAVRDNLLRRHGPAESPVAQ